MEIIPERKGNKVKFAFNDMLVAMSQAFDYVEKELVGVTVNHGKRVACMCVAMGTEKGLTKEQIADLAAYAMLHDNALTEYILEEYKKGGKKNKKVLHCVYGEENMKKFPMFQLVEGAILYHHENADGSGYFGKCAEDTPVFARWIHLGDMVDSIWKLDTFSEEKYESIVGYITKNSGRLFSKEDVQLFLNAMPKDKIIRLQNSTIDDEVKKRIPFIEKDFSMEEQKEMGRVFAKIIDYKSAFTAGHSQGLAEKAEKMGQYYGFSCEKCANLYIAGTLHDIGKLAIDANILEKAGKLTEEEYREIQNHAKITYEILRQIHGFEEITSWASKHHEKLDGTGYPFGYTKDRMSKEDRLLACLDIYQALTEERPYKPSKTHGQVMEMLAYLGDTIDQGIVHDIDTVFGR